MISSFFRERPYINEPEFFPGDKESRERRKLGPREAILELRCAAARSRADSGGQKILLVVALTATKAGKELLVDHGTKYPL